MVTDPRLCAICVGSAQKGSLEQEQNLAQEESGLRASNRGREIGNICLNKAEGGAEAE